MADDSTEKPTQTQNVAGTEPTTEKSGTDEPLPEIDFATFVLSLSSSALYHLGELKHPETGQTEIDLTLAKQTIDILGLLEQKTKGNLSRDEEKMLGHLLNDLRIKYVQVTSRNK